VTPGLDPNDGLNPDLHHHFAYVKRRHRRRNVHACLGAIPTEELLKGEPENPANSRVNVARSSDVAIFEPVPTTAGGSAHFFLLDCCRPLRRRRASFSAAL
jgi:hypothetical protein